jgi:uncharacterized protein (DUF1778 family)
MSPETDQRHGDVPQASDASKSQRLVARVTADQKRLFQRAAALQGRSLSDFVIASAQDAAHRTIRDQEVLGLGARDSAVFVAALLKPSPVNERLRDTLRRHRKLSRRARA